jgi:hypothetical protein
MKTNKKALVESKSSKGRDPLEALCIQYAAIKREIDALEKSLEPVKTELMVATRALGGKFEIDDYTVTLVESERESFDLKLAKTKLEARILRPFIKSTAYSYVLVKAKL